MISRCNVNPWRYYYVDIRRVLKISGSKDPMEKNFLLKVAELEDFMVHQTPL